MAQPRAFVFTQPPYEAARFPVRATVFMQTRQHVEQRLDVCLAEAACWPRLELAEVDDVPDDPEVSPDIRTNIDVGADDFHYAVLLCR